MMRSPNEAVKLFSAAKSLCFLNFNSKCFIRSTMSCSVAASEMNLRKIFLRGVDSVLPKTIFRRDNFRIVGDKSRLEQVKCKFNDSDVLVDIGDRQCHLVGFGKGVFGMADAVSAALGERLKSGILSVPFGTVEKFQNIKLDKVMVCEGARDNLPDKSAVTTAKKIFEFIENLNESDVLFVLITGGGSALLPLPCQGVTLEEKCAIIKQLAAKGADINDINRVRIDLSQTKGGKLAARANHVGSVVSFIISDIIDDPIHLIASGPTVISNSDEITSKMVLEQHGLWNGLSEHIQNAITENSQLKLLPQKNITNLMIANNQTAVEAALDQTKQQNIPAVVLSTRIAGTVRVVNEAYVKLAMVVRQAQRNSISTDEFKSTIHSLQTTLRINDNFAEDLIEVVCAESAAANGFCLIAGGEPTVEITGNGIGGRNQELALRFSRSCYTNELLHGVQLLSAGTDGIDGTRKSQCDAHFFHFLFNFYFYLSFAVEIVLRSVICFQFFSPAQAKLSEIDYFSSPFLICFPFVSQDQQQLQEPSAVRK